MSRENVEVVRRGFEHFAATGEFLGEIFDPDFEWNMATFRGWPERQAYRGIEGAREFLADWAGSWVDWKLDVKDLVDVGDKVVAILHQQGRAKASGLEVDMEFAQVWFLRGGRQVRMDMYADASEALEAVGLRE